MEGSVESVVRMVFRSHLSAEWQPTSFPFPACRVHPTPYLVDGPQALKAREYSLLRDGRG